MTEKEKAWCLCISGAGASSSSLRTGMCYYGDLKKKKKASPWKSPLWHARQLNITLHSYLPQGSLNNSCLTHPHPTFSLFQTEFLSALFEIVHLGYLEHLIMCAEKSNTMAVSCMTCTACVTVTVIIKIRRSRSTPQVGMSDCAGYKL